MEETSSLPKDAVEREGSRRFPGRASVVVAAVVVLAAAAGVGVWLAVRDDGAGAAAPAAVAVNARHLRELAGAAAGAVYWAGPRAGITYEFTQAPDERTYVRYLPNGVPVGTATPYLTVGTYRVARAFAVTSDAARRPGMVAIPTTNGGVAFYDKARPTNVYMAFPGSSSQIEVYDPAASSLHKLVAAGRIGALDVSSGTPTTASTAAVASTGADLKQLGAQLGKHVYWLGPVRGTTNELTRTPDGRVYVRYLPDGVRVGVVKPYLTVASYPLKSAFAVTRAAARRPGEVEIALPGRGIAFYSRGHPTSVYIAYPGIDEQIEVFDPAARTAAPFAAARRVRSVS
jgi:hypothetical protein